MSSECACAKELLVDQDLAGKRLDQALCVLVPALGLRGRRRLIEQGLALLNGRASRSGVRLRLGDRLSLGQWNPPLAEFQGQSGESPLFLEEYQGLAFLYKPRFMHSVTLAGSFAPSLEALLPSICQGLELQSSGFKPRLLQRLDFGTSGLLCAALSPEAALAFRQAESQGQVEKRYLALLCGEFALERTASQALAGGKRKVKALASKASPERWSHFWPLKIWRGKEAQELGRDLMPEDDCHEDKIKDTDSRLDFLGASVLPQALSLVMVSIKQGARHQIRAHAAALGHPLFGDALYGGEACAAGFFLHAFALQLKLAGQELRTIVRKPPWPLDKLLLQEALERALTLAQEQLEEQLVVPLRLNDAARSSKYAKSLEIDPEKIGFSSKEIKMSKAILVAVPSDAPGGIAASPSAHFGHCAFYTIARIEAGQIMETQIFANPGHEHGGCVKPVEELAKQGVEVLLAGGMGMRPLAAMQQAGIKVYHLQSQLTVGAALEAFAQGRLKLFGEDQLCKGCAGHH